MRKKDSTSLGLRGASYSQGNKKNREPHPIRKKKRSPLNAVKLAVENS